MLGISLHQILATTYHHLLLYNPFTLCLSNYRMLFVAAIISMIFRETESYRAQKCLDRYFHPALIWQYFRLFSLFLSCIYSTHHFLINILANDDQPSIGDSALHGELPRNLLIPGLVVVSRLAASTIAIVIIYTIRNPARTSPILPSCFMLNYLVFCAFELFFGQHWTAQTPRLIISFQMRVVSLHSRGRANPSAPHAYCKPDLPPLPP